jgi:hypothetical protein
MSCPHWEHVEPHECSRCAARRAAQVTAAYPEFRAGRRRYVVVVRAGARVQHTDTTSLHEAWRIVAAYPHHPDLTVRLPPKETSR